MSKNPNSFMDILKFSEEYRWPKKGDRLLRDSEDWDRGVEFTNDEISRYVFIWSGYMGAGAALIEACEKDSQERHYLIYPILFNYRHGIELAMKWVIKRYGRYSTVKFRNTDHHNLWKLWEQCRQIIIEVGSENESIAVIEQVIKEFHDLDKSALAFRYSQNKNGALIALPDGRIDLQNIREVMEGVSHFFDGVDGELDHNAGAVDWE